VSAELIRRFYDAFARRDAQTMGTCYANDVIFSDPVFPRLVGEEARAMWRMLAARSQDFSLTYEGVEADAQRGKARWIAHYTFSKTGRHVENIIDAHFRFGNGLIVEHTDRFDFWRWSRQALGPAGLLLGWTSGLQKKVQSTAATSLAEYLAGSSASP
jgi:ketosteroid isomerase-like protein